MDNYNKIINKNHAPNSLQISCLKDIVAGKDLIDRITVLKNK